MKTTLQAVQVTVSNEVNEVEVAKRMEEFGKIITGVSFRYLNNKWVDREELEQELWVNLMSMIEEYGGPMEVHPNLVAKSSFNKSVDLYRYSRRRYEANQILEEENSDNDRSAFGAKFETAYNIVRMKEVYEKYPINSRERKYIIIKLVMSGTLDEEHITDPEDRKILLDLPENDIDSHIVWKLGYKSSSPGSFAALKRRMKKEITDFLLNDVELITS